MARGQVICRKKKLKNVDLTSTTRSVFGLDSICDRRVDPWPPHYHAPCKRISNLWKKTHITWLLSPQINRLPASGNVNIEFVIEIPKQTEVMQCKPCRLGTDRRTRRIQCNLHRRRRRGAVIITKLRPRTCILVKFTERLYAHMGFVCTLLWASGLKLWNKILGIELELECVWHSARSVKFSFSYIFYKWCYFCPPSTMNSVAHTLYIHGVSEHSWSVCWHNSRCYFGWQHH